MPLEKKVEVIRTMQRNHLTLRRPGELFNWGKSQIACMQKDKESLLSSYEAIAAGSRVHTSPSARTSEYAAINKALYQWQCCLLEECILTQLAEKAKETAE